MSSSSLFELDQSGFFKDRRIVDEEDEAVFDLSVGNNEVEWSIAPENTLFVIDWDDTLLATSWLARKQINLETPLIPEKESADLEALDAAICSFLRKIIFLYGKVLIVTNAQQGWVELSAKKFLPETYDLIFQPSSASSCCSFSSSSSGFRNDREPAESLNFSADYVQNHENHNNVNAKRLKVDWDSSLQGLDPFDSPLNSANPQSPSSKNSNMINVFSARYLFERDFPTDPSAWKRKAFQKLLKSRIASKFFIQREDSEQLENEAGSFPLDAEFGQELEEDFDADEFDLTNLVEVTGESFEIETDFNETDSFFSIDFRPSPMEDEDGIDDEFTDKNEDLQMDFGVSKSPSVSSNSSNVPQRIMKQACNLISMGDCIHDCESLRKLNLDLKNTFKKTIKMAEFPNISQLTKELGELEIYLDTITKTKQDFDLVVDRSYLA